MQPQVPDKARIAEGCSLHDGAPFTAICRRCGAYMCRSCSEEGRFNECLACRTRAEQEAASHVREQPLALGAVLSRSFELYKHNVGLITVTMLVVAAGWLALPALWTFAISEWHEPVSLFGGSLLLLAVQAVLVALSTSGALTIGAQLARGERASLESFLHSAGRLPAYLAFALLVGCCFAVTAGVAFGATGALFVVGWDPNLWPLIFLSVPVGIGLFTFVGLGLALAPLELVAQPHVDVLGALRNGWQLARGARLKLLGLASILWLLFIAGSMFFTVGLLFTLGYGLIVYCVLYLGLRQRTTLE